MSMKNKLFENLQNLFGGNASNNDITPPPSGSDVNQLYNDLVDDNLFIDGTFIACGINNRQTCLTRFDK